MTDSVSSYAFQAISPLAEGFTAAELNQRLATIQDNLRVLGAVMEVTHDGSALLGFNANVSADAEVGQPLYFDETDRVFKPSHITLVESEGRLLAGPESEAWALLLNKCDTVRGTLLFDGLGTVDLTASTGEANPFGKFYLSKTAGELTSTPEGMIVPVLLATGAGEVLFRPWFADTFPRYFPKLIEISALPAGVVASNGETYSFTSTDLESPGWIPATNGIFGGHRPVGAMLGYNWRADPNLVDIWPPLQPGECELLIDVGGSESRGYRVLPGNTNDRVLITEHGIWWMSPCYSHAPWQTVAEGQAGQTSCPKSFPRKLILRADFVHASQVAATEVTALRSKIDWLKVLRKDTSGPAIAGELDLAVDSESLFGSSTDSEGMAVKNYVNNRFTRGSVVSSIIAKSPALVITGGTSLPVVPGVGTPRAGSLVVDVNLARATDVRPQDVQLTNATTEAYGHTFGYGMRGSILSQITQTFHINTTIEEVDIRFYFWLLASSSLSLPAGLKLQKAIMSRPDGVGTLGVYADLDMPYTAGGSLTAGQYIELESDAITVHGGDIVYVSFTRRGDTDGVAGQLVLVNSFGKFQV